MTFYRIYMHHLVGQRSGWLSYEKTVQKHAHPFFPRELLWVQKIVIFGHFYLETIMICHSYNGR